MPTTTPSGLPYPAGSDFVNPANEIEKLAKATQSALNRQANAYSGTNAERQAHTRHASNGTLWSATDGEEHVYQFRDGEWFPEVQFVPLESAFGGNPVLRPSDDTGLYVHSFGRMVTGIFNFTNPSRNFNLTSGQLDLARVPARYAPKASLYGLIWGRGKNRSAALLRYAINRHTGTDDGRRVLVRPEEPFNIDVASGSWVSFTVTWPIF